MRTFVYSDEKSNRFWNVTLQGNSYTVTYGKVGSKGQTKTKDFADDDQARKAYAKVIAEKVKKGYVETTSVPTAELTPLLRSLEVSLAADPEDLASHSAYADYLAEQGDSRGELIQLQLSLEDERIREPERSKLQSRVDELIEIGCRTWLGDLGRFLVGHWSGLDKPFHFEIRRGWLDRIRILPFPDAIARSLANCPEVRLLRRLEVIYDMRYHPWEFDDWIEGPNAALREGEELFEFDEDMENELVILPEILKSPYLQNLRVFEFGYSATEEQISHTTMVTPFANCTVEDILKLLERAPNLEELYLNADVEDVKRLFSSDRLGNLRVLQYYYGMGRYQQPPELEYPLSALADNSSLKNLTTLRLHPGRDASILLDEVRALLHSKNLPNLVSLQIHQTRYGDDLVPVLIESGILNRLKVLDLGYGLLTDKGARQLANCPELKNLDWLAVSKNALTQSGIDLLKSTGSRVRATDQHLSEENQAYFT